EARGQPDQGRHRLWRGAADHQPAGDAVVQRRRGLEAVRHDPVRCARLPDLALDDAAGWHPDEPAGWLLPACRDHARRAGPAAAGPCAVAVHGALRLPGADPDGVPARPWLAGLRPLAALVLDRRRDRSADGAWRGLATKSDAGVGRSLIRIRPEKNQPSVRLVFSIQGRKHKRHEWVVITLALKLFPARPRN